MLQSADQINLSILSKRILKVSFHTKKTKDSQELTSHTIDVRDKLLRLYTKAAFMTNLCK
jgi:hypothetical protein